MWTVSWPLHTFHAHAVEDREGLEHKVQSGTGWGHWAMLVSALPASVGPPCELKGPQALQTPSWREADTILYKKKKQEIGKSNRLLLSRWSMSTTNLPTHFIDGATATEHYRWSH